MAEPRDSAESINDEPVPQPARPVGSRPDSDWTAVSGSGDAEYGEPAAERDAPDRPFATSADSPLDSDINRRIPAADPVAAAEEARSAADDELPGGTNRPAETGVPDADPSETWPPGRRTDARTLARRVGCAGPDSYRPARWLRRTG